MGSMAGYPDYSVRLYRDLANVFRTDPETILLLRLAPAPTGIREFRNRCRVALARTVVPVPACRI
jgi:hypothetical protein